MKYFVLDFRYKKQFYEYVKHCERDSFCTISIEWPLETISYTRRRSAKSERSLSSSIFRSNKTTSKRKLKAHQTRRGSSAVRMSAMDQLPLVTTLLRASRDANEILIKAALRDIIVNGITKEELNSADKSGRVSQCDFRL